MSGSERLSTNRRSVLRGAGVGAVAIATSSFIPSAVAEEPDELAGKVVFIYDDSPREDYTKAFPVHQEYGVPGCAAVCPGLIGTTSAWLRPDELEEMYDAGWEVMSHSLIHRALGEIPVLGDIEADDSKIHVDSNLHGTHAGDPIVIFDGSNEATATVVGRSEEDDEDYILLEEPIGTAFEAGDGTQTWVRYTDEFTQEILEESKQKIEDWGFGPVTAYVHTYNRYDGYVSEVAPEYYDTIPNRRRDPLNPTFEPDPFELGRVNFEDNKLDQSELIDMLDLVANEPYFGIIYGHSNYDAFTQDRIAKTIELCQERNIEIVTLQSALAGVGVLDEDQIRRDNSGSTTTDTSLSPFEGITAAVQDMFASIRDRMAALFG